MSQPEPDWTLWRSFLAVMSEGSQSAAARKLGLSQPTLGRHIEALEQALGTPLFVRALRGLDPTPTARRLGTEVETAARALAEARLLAEGASESLTGTVRLTASMVTAHYTLPPILRRLRLSHPDIQIELVPSDSAENLLMREADIAIRMFRPTQLDLITRRIAGSGLTACAHQSYLDRRGIPATPQDLVQHDLIGFDRSDLLILMARQMGFDLKRGDFALRTDSQTLFWELAKAGNGICFAQTRIIADTPGMVAILPGLRIPPLEVWLTTHKELFSNRRIRAIYDRLADELTAYYS